MGERKVHWSGCLVGVGAGPVCVCVTIERDYVATIERLTAERDWAWRMIRAAWPAMPPAHTPQGLVRLMLDDESLPDEFPPGASREGSGSG